MQTVRMAVRISAGDGHRGGAGELEMATLPLLTRVRSAGLLFLLGAGIGALLLPVPLIHLFGVMFFLAMSYQASRRLMARTVVRAARGRCPSCGEEAAYYVGMGGKRLSFPISTSCPRCRLSLELEGDFAPRTG